MKMCIRDRSNNECELNNLCVLPTYRHRKIGQELLFHAFNTAKKTNCVKINIGIVPFDFMSNSRYNTDNTTIELSYSNGKSSSL